VQHFWDGLAVCGLAFIIVMILLLIAAGGGE